MAGSRRDGDFTRVIRQHAVSGKHEPGTAFCANDGNKLLESHRVVRCGRRSHKLSFSTTSGKPIDRWLGLLGIVVGIALFLLTKTPALVIVSVSAIFLLLLRPMLNFWWIEDTNTRRAIAVMCLAVVCFLIGYASWPAPATKIPTAAEIADEFDRRAPKNPPPGIPDRPLAGMTPLPQNKKLEPAPRGGRAPGEQLTITAPKDGSTVSQNPPIEFTYVNVPADHHVWLIVVGDEPPPASNQDLY